MIGETLRAPRPGPGVCVDCFTITRPGYARCLVCQHTERHLDAVVPIAYSVAGGGLHRDIRSYKRDADPSVDDAVNRLAGLLRRFLPEHERCLAAAAGAERFDLVTTVPSQHAGTGVRHPLERILGELMPVTADRYERVLARTEHPAQPRQFDARRYASVRRLEGTRVLLIDDMWTSGASAQSAAAALRAAGAARVGGLVIGRQLNRNWSNNAARLDEVSVPLGFATCALCAQAAARRPTHHAA